MRRSVRHTIQVERVTALASLAVIALACGRPRDRPRDTTAAQVPGCVRLDPAQAVDSTSTTEDVRRGRGYRCVLHAGDATLIARLIADSSTNTVDSIVVRRADGTVSQTLTPGGEEPPSRGAEPFRAIDFDGDGRFELALLTMWGATGNTFWNIWRQDAATGRFSRDSTLSELATPVPVAGACVASHANGGAAGMIYDSVIVCRRDGNWIDSLVASSRPGRRDNEFIVVVRERRGDSLVVVRTDTVRDTLR
jgi:hypothetical protein